MGQRAFVWLEALIGYRLCLGFESTCEMSRDLLVMLRPRKRSSEILGRGLCESWDSSKAAAAFAKESAICFWRSVAAVIWRRMAVIKV